MVQVYILYMDKDIDSEEKIRSIIKTTMKNFPKKNYDLEMDAWSFGSNESRLFQISKPVVEKGKGGSGDWVIVKYIPEDSLNDTKEKVRLRYKKNGLAGNADREKDVHVDELSGRVIISYIREKLGEFGY